MYMKICDMCKKNKASTEIHINNVYKCTTYSYDLCMDCSNKLKQELDKE